MAIACNSSLRHRWLEDLLSGRAATIASIAQRDRQQVSHVSRNLSLAFLAPDITEMILTGRQPITLTPERLQVAHPCLWTGTNSVPSCSTDTITRKP